MADQKSTALQIRGQRGTFAAGHKGIGGRPRMSPEVRAILEAATPQAAQTLVDQLKATKPHGLMGEEFPDNDARRRAAEAIFDRLIGKPIQAIVDETPAGLGAATDLSALDVEDLKALQAIRKKLWVAALTKEATHVESEENKGDENV